jgi:hypothetical protein
MNLLTFTNREKTIYMFKFEENGKIITYKDILKSSKSLISILMTIFKKITFYQYYIECKPISYQLMDTEFEIVFIQTRNLSSVANSSLFNKDHPIETNKNDVKVFKNLNGDTTLIVPCNNGKSDYNSYTHIGRFFKPQNVIQQRKLLKTMFDTYFKMLKEKPSTKFLMSTHGHGVPWLHIRITHTFKYSVFYKK